MLSITTQQKLVNYFRYLADLELSVEQGRQELANLYDFEPYAAFCRVDMDGNKLIYCMDVYNFLQQNDRKQFSVKDCQLMLAFYDLDNSGSVTYNEFMKFVLPCHNPQLREDVCQRKTFQVDVVNGQRLHDSVEVALADFLEREINFHIKNEMLKNQLLRLPDWNSKAAFNLIDSQRQGYISHFNLYGFVNSHKFDASDEELIGIIRRIEGMGNSQVTFDEFKEAFRPIIVRMVDICFAEDEKGKMKEHKVDDLNQARPFLAKLAATKPINQKNSVDVNLQLYDQYKNLERGEVHMGSDGTLLTPMKTEGRQSLAAQTAKKSMLAHGISAHKTAMTNNGNTPLRMNAQQAEVYGSDGNASPGPFPRGPPMTDMTGVHPGTVMTMGGEPILKHGHLNGEDERELVQVMYEMILNEQEIEKSKQLLAEQGDFNLMDAFQMLDDRNLGWVSAPQILAFLFENGVYAHKDDVYHFVRRFDRDNDSRLQYSDFCEAFTPKDSYYQHQIQNRKARYIHNKDVPKKLYFTEQTRDIFFKCLKTHMHTDQKIEIAKKKCARRPTFNIHDAFAAVDQFRQGHLTREDLKRLLQRNGFHCTESELTWLTARFDRRLMGIIQYQEFMDEVMPRTSLLGDIASVNVLKLKM